MWNTVNGQKPRTTSLGISLMPQTRTATPRDRKIAPSSKNGIKMVRNIIRNNLRFIDLSMAKTEATQTGSAKYSKKGLRIETSLSNQQIITRGSPEK